jgi:hypothetical protein
VWLHLPTLLCNIHYLFNWIYRSITLIVLYFWAYTTQTKELGNCRNKFQHSEMRSWTYRLRTVILWGNIMYFLVVNFSLHPLNNSLLLKNHSENYNTNNGCQSRVNTVTTSEHFALHFMRFPCNIMQCQLSNKNTIYI